LNKNHEAAAGLREMFKEMEKVDKETHKE